MNRMIGLLCIPAAAILLVYFTAPRPVRFAREPDARSAALKEAHRTVWREMKQAAQQGKSRCCLKWPCTQCILTKGACTCMADLKAKKAVCHECKGAWCAGDGAVEGVKAEDVQVQPRERIGPPK